MSAAAQLVQLLARLLQIARLLQDLIADRQHLIGANDDRARLPFQHAAGLEPCQRDGNFAGCRARRETLVLLRLVQHRWLLAESNPRARKDGRTRSARGREDDFRIIGLHGWQYNLLELRPKVPLRLSAALLIERDDGSRCLLDRLPGDIDN